MGSISILKTTGLYTSVNEVSSAPDGALTQADNVIIRHPNIIEPRRGFLLHTSGTAPNCLYHYSAVNKLIGHASTGTLRNYSGSFNYTGTFEVPDTEGRLRLKAVEAQRNFYVTSRAGVYAIDSGTMTTPYKAGVVEASTPTVVLAAGTWMSDATAVAYRVVWGRKDANGQLHFGKPSGRAILVNASGSAKQASITLAIPSEVTTSFFYRIYRSEMSASATSEPDDELFLVYENVPTSSDISAGYVTISDITPEILLADPLYTNPSQSGFLQANDRPPWCWDITEWAGRVWYANTKLPQRLEFQILTPPANGDVFTVFGQSYKCEQPAASGAADAWTLAAYAATGLTTSAQQIAYAAQRLVHTINLRNKLGSGNQNYGDIRASYVSSPEDAPGKILIEATSYSVSAGYLGVSITPTYVQPISDGSISVTSASTSRASGTTVTVTTGSAHGFSVGDSVVLTSTGVSATPAYYNGHDSNFPPGIKTVASTPSSTTFTYAETGSNVTMSGSYSVHKALLAVSDNDTAPNRVYYSKFQEPEAVPFLNYFDVGVKNKPIWRIVPLRERLYVFKPDGIYVVSAEYPFRVDLLDNTVRIMAADSIAVVSNAIYVLTDHGVVAVSDAGVKIVSKPIERAILQALANDDGNQIERATAMGYELDNIYVLWLKADTYVYNTATNTWTRWDLTFRSSNSSAGCVYYGDGSTGAGHTKMLICMPDGIATDYSESLPNYAAFNYLDYTGRTTTVSSHTSSTATLASVTGISVGDLVSDEVTGAKGVVGAINGSTITWRMTNGTDFTNSNTVTIYRAVSTSVKYAAVHGGMPNNEKHFAAVTYHFRRSLFNTAYGTFETDKNTTESTRLVQFSDVTHTAFPSTATYWESRTVPSNKRIYIDQDHQRCSYLVPGFKVQEAYAMWALNGITIEFEPMSERNSR